MKTIGDYWERLTENDKAYLVWVCDLPLAILPFVSIKKLKELCFHDGGLKHYHIANVVAEKLGLRQPTRRRKKKALKRRMTVRKPHGK